VLGDQFRLGLDNLGEAGFEDLGNLLVHLLPAQCRTEDTA
jgi:hypothetical protein